VIDTAAVDIRSFGISEADQDGKSAPQPVKKPVGGD